MKFFLMSQKQSFHLQNLEFGNYNNCQDFGKLLKAQPGICMLLFSHIYYPSETHFALYDSVYCVGGKTLEQAVKRICGCPKSKSIKGQGVWDLEKTGLGKVVQDHGRRAENR